MKSSGRSTLSGRDDHGDRERPGGRLRPGTRQSFACGGAALWLERGAFFALLLIVGMRPLLSETYESGEGLFADYVRSATITTPATTAGFDLVIWLAAGVAALAGVIHHNGDTTRNRWRWTGLEIGWLIMVMAAAASTVWAASNKRLAMNASVDWLTIGALAMTLARLCRERLRIALLLGVVAAAGAASAVKSAVQVGSEYRLTREDYEQNKDRLWRDVPPDDPRRLLYEHRLAANEATGFLAFANAEGSLLMLCGFAAAAASGLTGLRWARWALRAGGVAMVAAVLLTGSKGAFLAAICGAMLLLVLHLLRGRLRRRWRAALTGGWAAVLLAAAGVTGLGLARGGLPGASLAFRWDYWRVTTTIIGEHPIVGVGALNFDRAYLPHKPIQFPEEIRDPHNFVLAIWAQWGTLGLVGMVVAAVGASIVVARRWARVEASGLADGSPVTDAGRNTLGPWVLGTIAGFVALRLWVMRGLLATETGQATIFVDLVQYVGVWAVAFTVVSAVASRDGRRGGMNWRLIVLCGVAAFLLHNTVDFAIFVPGAVTVFAALVGMLLAEGSAQDSGFRVQGSGGGAGDVAWRSWNAVAPLVVAIAGLLATLVLVFGPVSRSAEALSRARGAALDVAAGYYAEAAAADPFDPVPFSELAERIACEPTPERVDAALAALNQAVQRDPLQAGLHRWLAQFHDLRYRMNGTESDLHAAIASARRVLELYPQSPDEHLNLAAVLAHAAAATGRLGWADEARAEYVRALELDRVRPGLREVRKWSPQRRAEIEAAMNSVAPPPASLPAT